MEKGTQYVWYASYGSNINRERFLCYIKGGSPKGSSRIETGCRDTTLPADEANLSLHYPLYFAKEAAGWGSKGVAFIGLKEDKDTVTYSKAYLITTEQFLDVLKQENSGSTMSLDLQFVKERGSHIFDSGAWYGNILYVGEKLGYPIFTFTAPQDMNNSHLNKPSHAYLQTIITGLRIAYSEKEIYDYFLQKPGINGFFSEEELRNLVYR